MSEKAERNGPEGTRIRAQQEPCHQRRRLCQIPTGPTMGTPNPYLSINGKSQELFYFYFFRANTYIPYRPETVPFSRSEIFCGNHNSQNIGNTASSTKDGQRLSKLEIFRLSVLGHGSHYTLSMTHKESCLCLEFFRR